MRKIDTFESVINRVHAMSTNYFDESVPVLDMEFNSLEKAWISNKEIEVMPSAQRLIANRLRVPHSYLSRCPADLQARNLNYWIREEAKNRENLFCRFDGDKLRAVFTDRYTALDHLEVLSKMLEYGFTGEEEVHYSLDDEIMLVKIPDYGRSFSVGGDKLIPGISISNSEVGILAFCIEAYFYRLVCSNGLIAQTAIASRFKHISRRALDDFPGILSQVVIESQRSQDRFRISLESRVENPLSSISAFNRQFQLSKKEAEAVEQGYDWEPGFTMFHVINAYTRAAHGPGRSAEEAYRLERVGGLILGMVKE